MSSPTSAVKRWYFTFGASQYFGLLQDFYLVIQSETEMSARTLMIDSSFGFGQKWCGCYDEETWEKDAKKYFKHKLGEVDMFGNIVTKVHKVELVHE